MSGLDSNVKLLLHGDGTNGSTTITDSSSSAHTQTCSGSACINTGAGKFSGSYLKFNGTTDYITCSNSSDFDFGAGDFTIDYWVYQMADGVACCHISRERTPTFPPFLIGFNGSQVYMSSTGSGWNIADGKTIGGTLVNTWSHIALVRSGNTYYTFRDGIQKDTWTSSATLPTKTNPLAIGSGQNGNYFPGYIDELRVSKGIARWTSNFTPPTAAYSATTGTPGVVSGMGNLRFDANYNSQIAIIDSNPIPCDRYEFEFQHVVSDIETPPSSINGALLTMYASTNGGITFDFGPYYNNTGDSNFAGESNPAYLPLPHGMGLPQTLNLGMRLSCDTSDLPEYGATGIVQIYNSGIGNLTYTVDGCKGGTGAGAHQINPNTGQPWFAANGTQYFHWSIPVRYSGHYSGAPGQRVNAFLIMMNGGQTQGALIKSGIFKLRRMD